MFYQLFISFIIFSSLFCQVFASITETVPSIERKLPSFPYTNAGGRMIEKPRRRMKPKSTTLPPTILRFKRSEQTDSYLEPFADAMLEAAFSQEQLPLDRYPKRSRNRVSEGF